MSQSDPYGPARADGAPDAVGTPPALTYDAARTGQMVRALEAAVAAGLGSLKGDVERLERIGHTNFLRILMAFAAGFLILAGMTIESYRWSREDLAAAQNAIKSSLDKQAAQIDRTKISVARVEQKLDDLTHPLSPLPRR